MSAELMKMLSNASMVPVSKIDKADFFESFLLAQRMRYEESDGAPAQFASYPEGYPAELAKALGVERLYRHQRAAIDAVELGKDVILRLPTAAGKTVAFNAPVIRGILENRGRKTALYIMPLKALIDDQREKLEKISRSLGKPLKISVLTGDVKTEDRLKGLVGADICFISPDLLHHQLYKVRKPDWDAWVQFLRKLSYVVIDEAHTYIGSFGSNFALLMRRLSLSVQVCGGGPDNLRFILATATIANPLNLAQKLTGRTEFRLIEKSGAASHKSYVAATPNGSIELIDRLARALMDGPDISGIIFCNSRNEVKSIQSQLSRSLPGRVQAYYGGLNPANRRNVVEAVRSGATRIIVTTSALEAGIDLPDLDFCICYGFPESLMSWRQRIGRAGRSGARLALFVPKSDKPLDRFYQDDPRLLMGEPEKGVVPDSKLFTERHIRCAITESRPNSADLQTYFGLDIATAMKMSGARLSGDRLELSGYPHMGVNLRGSSGKGYRLMLEGKEIEAMAQEVANQEAYVGAVYEAHSKEGVDRLRVKAWSGDEIIAEYESSSRETVPSAFQTINIVEQLRDPIILGDGPARFRLTFNWVTVSRGISGYKEFTKRDTKVCPAHGEVQGHKCPECGKALERETIREMVEQVEFEKPLISRYQAPAWRLEINAEQERLTGNALEVLEAKAETLHESEVSAIANPTFSALHGLGHVLCKAAPLSLLVAPQDLGSLVTKDKGGEGLASYSLYVHDTTDGGSGAAEGCLDSLVAVVKNALKIMEGCDCKHGCPRCLTEYRCPQGNKTILKFSAAFLTSHLIQALESVEG